MNCELCVPPQRVTKELIAAPRAHTHTRHAAKAPPPRANRSLRGRNNAFSVVQRRYNFTRTHMARNSCHATPQLPPSRFQHHLITFQNSGSSPVVFCIGQCSIMNGRRHLAGLLLPRGLQKGVHLICLGVSPILQCVSSSTTLDSCNANVVFAIDRHQLKLARGPQPNAQDRVGTA